jgi:hypothetical protein
MAHPASAAGCASSARAGEVLSGWAITRDNYSGRKTDGPAARPAQAGDPRGSTTIHAGGGRRVIFGWGASG